MQIEVFSMEGRFFKGNLHTHSNKSDGILEPSEVCKRYETAGYDFISLTDHLVGRYNYPIVDTNEFCNEKFTTLIGSEVHSGAMLNGELWHLVAVGLPLDFIPPETPDFSVLPGMETANDLAKRCIDNGAFLSIAHPQWSGLVLEDALSIDNFHAVECYNHGSAMQERGDGFTLLDALLDRGRRCNITAADDAHFKKRDFFRGWVMVKALENSPEALLDSLKAGNYYSSQGPEIYDLRYENDKILVRSSPIERIVLCGKATTSQYVECQNSELNEIKLVRCKNSSWIRVTIIDQFGRRAWSNPIWL
mgnify:FL=1|tara:strand:+ start:8178 stop:9095 length:918 start_codon:yes stop_codon:yes gene_type:complete